MSCSANHMGVVLNRSKLCLADANATILNVQQVCSQSFSVLVGHPLSLMPWFLMSYTALCVLLQTSKGSHV